MGNQQSSTEKTKTVKTPDQIRADNIRAFVLRNPLPHTQILDYDYYKSAIENDVSYDKHHKDADKCLYKYGRLSTYLGRQIGLGCYIMSYDVICNAGDYSIHELVYPDKKENTWGVDFDALYAFESEKPISLILDDDINKHIPLTYDLYTRDRPLCIFYIYNKKLFTIDQDNTRIKFKIMGFGSELRSQMMNLNISKGTYSANFQVRSCGGMNSINF